MWRRKFFFHDSIITAFNLRNDYYAVEIVLFFWLMGHLTMLPGEQVSMISPQKSSKNIEESPALFGIFVLFKHLESSREQNTNSSYVFIHITSQSSGHASYTICLISCFTSKIYLIRQNILQSPALFFPFRSKQNR